MTLTTGSKLGPYEVLAPLGAGGMGEVYRARDTRLDRTVAIKILSTQHSQNADAKERFDREGRAISSLSHPNICHLYDVGQQDGTNYLVMEYLEGETLADRLRRGPLPPEQVLRVGTEICEGLERAHRQGVVHRDLKPGNIMLTKAGAKLMDFGLAKPVVAAVPAGLSSASLATMSHPLTAEGTILGTFQYMSPEQMEGKEADVRSDIFSLGAMLYEMITGKLAFEGKTAASIIAAVLAAEPKPISMIQPTSPPAFEPVVRACLAKDPDERLQTAHDVKLQLKWIAEGIGPAGAPGAHQAARHNQLRAWWFIAPLLFLIVGGGATWWIIAHQTAPAMYFNSPVPFAANAVALSPDGRTLALVAYSDRESKYVIWTHEVGSRGVTAVPGTEDGSHPFWSPDSRSIGFFAQGKLKKVEVSRGTAQVLCDAPNGRGGTWNQDGTILFAPNATAGLYRVSSAGGAPVEVTQPDASRSESSNRWPVFLPDGRHFLYLGANFSGQFEKNEIFVGSLDSAERKPIVGASSNPAYADPGYLLYVRDNALVAQRFDARSYVLSGDPHTVGGEVQYLPQIDLALFSVAGKKMLVAQTGRSAVRSQLTWFDRSGRAVGTLGPPGSFGNPRLSPDGRRVAFDQVDPSGRNVDIWIHELASDAVTRLTFGPVLNSSPVWSPDGKRIAFAGNRKSSFHLLQKNADGSGSEQEITDRGATVQTLGWDWSQDGKYLLAREGKEVWYLSLAERQMRPLLQTSGIVRNAQFSPDGRWVAYSSNETGDWEVYVSPFPTVSSKWQVSRSGGEEPRWRGDGKELFYFSGEGKMMAVAVKAGSSFEAGSPVTLFQAHISQPVSSQEISSYDVSRDGMKFLINTKVAEPKAAPLSIILNWASEMER